MTDHHSTWPAPKACRHTRNSIPPTLQLFPHTFSQAKAIRCNLQGMGQHSKEQVSEMTRVDGRSLLSNIPHTTHTTLYIHSLKSPVAFLPGFNLNILPATQIPLAPTWERSSHPLKASGEAKQESSDPRFHSVINL